MARPHRPHVWLCSAWLWLVAGSASAQHDLAQAASLESERGAHAFAQGDYRAAIAAFQRADQLQPDAALAADIGRAYDELQASDRAVVFYREYLRRAPGAPERAAIEARIAELSEPAHERRAQPVWLRSQPAGATVWIDTEPVGKAPLRLELTSGVHRATFRLPDHRPQTVPFEVLPGQGPAHVEAQLAAANGAPADASRLQPAPAASTRGTAARRERGQRVLRGLGLGAMLAGATALGGAVALEALRANSADSAAQDRDPLRASQARERAETQKTLSRVFAGAGGGLAAIGVTLLVLSREPSEERRPTSRVALHCALTKCRAELSGVF